MDEHGRIGEFFFFFFFFLINDEHERIGDFLFFSLNLMNIVDFQPFFYFILDSVVPSLTDNESLLIN